MIINIMFLEIPHMLYDIMYMGNLWKNFKN